MDGRSYIYINGADFNFVGGEALKPGYIRLITPDGQLRQVAGDIDFPNGMVIKPDKPDTDHLRVIRRSAHRPRYRCRRRAVRPGGLHRGPSTPEGAVRVSTGGYSIVRVAEGGEILQRVDFARTGHRSR